ncbi:dihydroneopterin aldolase family protein [Natronobiforma cellulositropha]|uniref:dihydroneopterin aldolase family protein n=1 Tax=Natronobiforma cellulositropha TaxID=1679076 RepID=UPI0021D5E1F0|nr:dihydroneopterin aldolase family protein [Natronobiforma cellulositropha]
MDPTTSETACFEAGIKFGSLYHQFAGTPITVESAPSLARAMEAAIENQPHCERVTVEIDEEALEAACLEGGEYGYTELTGAFLEVEIVIDYEGCRVHTQMELEDGYPLMRLLSVDR